MPRTIKEKISEWWWRRLRRIASKFESLYETISKIWRVPLGMLGAIGKFFSRLFWQWRESSRFRSFVYGLPAAVVIALAGYVAIATWRTPKGTLISRYDQRAQAAIGSGDSRYAKLCLERLIQLRGEDVRTLFELAKLYAQENNPRRVDALMRRIAPVNEPTIAEAHVWQAQNLLAKRELTIEEVSEVEKQLGNALKLKPNDRLARSLMGQVMAQTGRDRDAYDMYRGISPRMPGDNFRLAEVASRIGEGQVARSSAEAALGDYRTQLSEDRESWGARQNVMKTLVFLERFEEALQVLEQTPPVIDKNLVQQTAVMVYATWNQVLQQQKADVPLRIAVVEQSLKLDPTSVPALNAIIDVLTVAEGNDLEQVRAILQRMLALGSSTALVHLCIGTDAIMHDDFVEALKHLQLAYREDPNLVAAANNLAWAMANTDQPKLDEALALIDTVLEQNRGIAAVHDTRGQILIRLQRWSEAISELELALQGMPESQITRESLVLAYQQMGMEKMANEHAFILQKMRGE